MRLEAGGLAHPQIQTTNWWCLKEAFGHLSGKLRELSDVGYQLPSDMGYGALKVIVFPFETTTKGTNSKKDEPSK